MSDRGLLRPLVVLLGLASTPAHAQVVPTVDVGVISLGYSGTARATALSVTPAMRVDGPMTLAMGSATFSQFDGGEWSAQGALATSVFSPSWGAFRGELAATATAIAYRDVFRTGDGLLRARVHAHSLTLGGWAGGGGGWSRHADAWHPLALADAGVWSEHGPLRLTAAITSRYVAVADSFFSTEGAFARFRRRGAHVDATVGISWQQGPLELHLMGGAREGGELARDAEWASLSATLRLTPWASVIAEAGGEPEVVSQRLPQGRYGLLALRFSPTAPPVPMMRTSPSMSAEFILGSEIGGLRRVRVLQPGARRIELRADFTDWQPVPLARAPDGSWQIALPLAPGVYRVSIRVDGGEWRAPPGVPAVRDEFGAMVGLVVVR